MTQWERLYWQCLTRGDIAAANIALSVLLRLDEERD